MRTRRGWCIGLLLIGGMLAVLYVARQTVLPALAHWLDVGVQPQRGEYDCVMVLGGDDNVRPFVGAALYKAGLARRVLLARVESHPDANPEFAPPRHDVSRQILLLRGVPEHDIQVAGEPCQSTLDEAQVLAQVLDASPELRVLVVTSDYHTRRARWVFDRVLADRAGQAAFVSAPTEQVPLDRWWHSEAGFRAITSEYVKLLLYGLRYGYLGYWIAGFTAGAIGVYLVWRRRRRRGRYADGSDCAGKLGCASGVSACGAIGNRLSAKQGRL